MEKDSFNMIIISTKANFQKDKYTDMVDIHGKMVQATRGNGHITACMVKVFSNGKMGRSSKEAMNQI